jgi:hypothetical protein
MSIKLNTERMKGNGPGAVKRSGYQSNYLYGLDDLCKKFLTADMTVLEIGSNCGVSTALFCSYAKHVTAVDIRATPALVALADKTENLTFHHGRADRYIAQIRDTDLRFDLVYIDACHGFRDVKKDIENSLLALKPEGVLSGHDMRVGTGVSAAVKHSFPGIFDGTTILHRFSDSSWAIDLSEIPPSDPS